MSGCSQRQGAKLLLSSALVTVCMAGPIACLATAGTEAAEAGSQPEAAAAGEVRATILRATLRVAESMPPQYFVDVVSALENGCVRFSRTDVRRDGATIFIRVWNTRPLEGERIACTMIYGEKETAVALGSDFVSGERYTLDVNGERQSFVAQ